MAKTKYVCLVLFSTLLLLAASVIYAGNVQAQSQATVNILPVIGGSTDPGVGTYSYNDGTSVSITATGDTNTGAAFSNWIIMTSSGVRISSDNPLTFPVSGGSNYTIEAVFQVPQLIGIGVAANLVNAAVVDILPAAGGSTNPVPGMYAFTNATAFNITAMPENGWTFSHWVISGNTSLSHGGSPVNLEPTDNPYNVNHGYGQTYYYQAVFTQSGASTSPGPSASIPELPIFAVLLFLGAMVIPVVVLARKHKTH